MAVFFVPVLAIDCNAGYSITWSANGYDVYLNGSFTFTKPQIGYMDSSGTFHSLLAANTQPFSIVNETVFRPTSSSIFVLCQVKP